MGIPSYYKKLIDTIPGLVSKGHPDASIAWLFMDFNCLIYHCLYRKDTPVYPGEQGKEEWEAQFLDCIQTYCLKVIKEVKPKTGVFIAIDGVVPMAKMKQQRLRRFKSVWLSQHTESADVPTWDKNSITPGTAFMTKLRVKLQDMIKKYGKKTWKLSSSDEPGEGEHKIINQWREGGYAGNFAVYGLDGDLIVLSILGRESLSLSNQIWLFREEMNAGTISYDSMGEEEFEWFSIHLLRDWLCSDYKEASLQRSFILSYCFAMSVLGNDFLPSSLGLKIRENGHSELIEIVKQLVSHQNPLVSSEDLRLSLDGILSLFRMLYENEEYHITKYIGKKIAMASHHPLKEEPEIGHHDWPMFHMEENLLMDSHKQLIPNWQSAYLTRFFPGCQDHLPDIEHICQEYLYGIQWIWAYYTGNAREVCFNWYYSFTLPPLWQWICTYLQSHEALPSFPKEILLYASDIQPTQQLALVLPLESWNLLPPGPEKQLPYIAPHFFPTTFDFDTIGKRFFWECESMIPLPSMHTLQELLKHSS